ncbi:MAG: lipocalin-like domain-containing protein [Promethearchaeota archaeon]
MTQNSFVGTWRLRSLEYRRADGQVSYPFGRDFVGYIMYNEDGYMSVAIMSGNRPKFASGDLRGGTTEEKVAAADTYVSYCGKYKVQGDQVIHSIEVSFFPNWSGVEQIRFFEFKGNRLSLSTPPFLAAGIQQTAHLIWERV